MPDFTNTPDYFIQALDKIKATHLKKRADYSVQHDPFSNFKEAANVANISTSQAIEVLIGVKQARLRQLSQPGRIPLNESIEDTLLDRAVYAFIAYAYYLKVIDLHEPQEISESSTDERAS